MYFRWITNFIYRLCATVFSSGKSIGALLLLSPSNANSFSLCLSLAEARTYVRFYEIPLSPLRLSPFRYSLLLLVHHAIPKSHKYRLTDKRWGAIGEMGFSFLKSIKTI